MKPHPQPGFLISELILDDASIPTKCKIALFGDGQDISIEISSRNGVFGAYDFSGIYIFNKRYLEVKLQSLAKRAKDIRLCKSLRDYSWPARPFKFQRRHLLFVGSLRGKASLRRECNISRIMLFSLLRKRDVCCLEVVINEIDYSTIILPSDFLKSCAEALLNNTNAVQNNDC